MLETFKKFDPVTKAVVAVGTVLVAGVALSGWITLPSTHAQDVASLMRQDSVLAEADLDHIAQDEEILELLRTIDRRTCIEAAPGPTELARCAER